MESVSLEQFAQEFVDSLVAVIKAAQRNDVDLVPAKQAFAERLEEFLTLLVIPETGETPKDGFGNYYVHYDVRYAEGAEKTGFMWPCLAKDFEDAQKRFRESYRDTLSQQYHITDIEAK